MLKAKCSLRSAMAVAAFALSAVITGCAARVGVGYRAYDPYYHDRHRWDDHEVQFYNRWNEETHRDSHRDFRRLKRNEQKEYWDWRHRHDDKR